MPMYSNHVSAETCADSCGLLLLVVVVVEVVGLLLLVLSFVLVLALVLVVVVLVLVACRSAGPLYSCFLEGAPEECC